MGLHGFFCWLLGLFYGPIRKRQGYRALVVVGNGDACRLVLDNGARPGSTSIRDSLGSDPIRGLRPSQSSADRRFWSEARPAHATSRMGICHIGYVRTLL